MYLFESATFLFKFFPVIITIIEVKMTHLSLGEVKAIVQDRWCTEVVKEDLRILKFRPEDIKV